MRLLTVVLRRHAHNVASPGAGVVALPLRVISVNGVGVVLTAAQIRYFLEGGLEPNAPGSAGLVRPCQRLGSAGSRNSRRFLNPCLIREQPYRRPHTLRTFTARWPSRASSCIIAVIGGVDVIITVIGRHR